MTSIDERIAQELGVRVAQVSAAVTLLDEKATVPFIARYRKEATGGLDDTQLRTLDERLTYLRELEERRAAILASIEEQGKLTPELKTAVDAADTKARLEDLYAPYKPKRRTKGQAAREAGLEPLGLALWESGRTDPAVNAGLVPEEAAAPYVDADKGIADVAAALEGARWILIERFAEDAELIGGLRQFVWEQGEWSSSVIDGKQQEGIKFSDYFAASEPLKQIPSHRALALFRGRDEDILRVTVTLPEPEPGTSKDAQPSEPERRIAARFGITLARGAGVAAGAGGSGQTPRAGSRPIDVWLAMTVRWTWRVKLLSQLSLDAERRLRDHAEEEAIQVFGRNLRDLLLAAPAGQRVTMGLDPGIRTGVKVAIVDGTGKLLDTTTIYPHEPRNDWEGSRRTLARLCRTHAVQLIAIGNGTASRETDRLVRDLIAQEADIKLTPAIVSEAGASVYSASALAAAELPQLDVSLRGAVSIARRLQDPLAELVRIEPKAIGVGQYQHDVSQLLLARKLDAIVEDCVNAVGADVNTASVPLLSRISGLTETLAKNIVAFRDEHGPFRRRAQLLKVPRVGDRTFQQAAGFLRIMNGEDPLDASAVHPESYPVVERIAVKTSLPVHALIGKAPILRTLRAEDLVDARFGLPTVKDILAELEKPGRDPRPEFKTAVFKEGIHTIQDVQPGMLLEGVVTNVANFGAFVDIGVHQDGLVHVSQLADRFVKDPHEVVKAGDIVKVRVLEVDLQRRRVALSMKTARDEMPASHGTGQPPRPPNAAAKRPPQPQQSQPKAPATSMAAAFSKLRPN